MNTKITRWLENCRAVLVSVSLMQMAAQGALAQNITTNDQASVKAWGAVCEGFRLAIVFPKDVFTNGEPITAKVLVQNVTTNYLHYYGNVPSDRKVIVMNSRKEELQTKEALRPKTPFEERLSKVVNNPKPEPVGPGKESVIPLRLDDTYDLSQPGTYFVVFGLTVPKPSDSTRQEQALSAMATIRVLGK